MDVTRKQLLAGAAATALAGCGGSTAPAPRRLTGWAAVRAAFDLDPRRRDFAAFYLAPHPAPVRAAIEHHRRGLDAGTHAYLAEHQIALDQATADAAAHHLGVPAREIAFTGSTTEGLALVYGGLDVAEGDELLTTEHDFYATHEALAQTAARTGARVRKIRLYDDPATADAGAMVRAIARAVTHRTRVLAITWVHSSSGVKLPVARIARAVRARNPRALVCVDAVHGFGAEAATPRALGCDVFVSGCHKWLMGPRGTGLVWATPAAWRRIRPLVPTFDAGAYVAWIDGHDMRRSSGGAFHTPGGFHAFEHRWALAQAFAFQREVGPSRIEARVHQLAARLRAGLADVAAVRLVSPPEAAGLVCFDHSGYSAHDVVDGLGSAGVVASVTPYATEHVRLGTSITLSERDVDFAVRAVRSL